MQVYADNAATTKIRPAALEKMVEVAATYYGNPSSLHTEGQKAKEVLEDCRSRMARMLGCLPKEIYFTSGGSESDNQAILSAARAGARKGKKHIISTAFEHHAVLHTLKKLEKEGFEVTLLPVGEKGLVSARQVEEAIRPDTCLVTVMFVNNEIGTIQPIAEIGEVCRAKKVVFHTDAVQAVGHLAVNVTDMKIDMLSLSAHKFGGPRGVGVLFCKTGVLLSNLIEGGAQERGKRAGTENLPAIAAMVVALEESLQNLDEKTAYIKKLQTKLIDGLSQIPHSALNGDRTLRTAGNISFCFEGIEGESLLLLLDEEGIEASSGSACTSGSLDPSHVLLAIGRVHDVAHGSLRISIGEFTKEEEVDYMLEKIPQVVAYLRNMSPVWRDLQTGKRQYIL